MVLVSYSDSEGSDTETTPVPAAKEAPKPSTTSSKPAFQKVVDRSQPHKIRITLPSTATDSSAATDDIEQEAPPAKKARTGGGAFSDFNSLLPAPKRPQATAKSAAAAGAAAEPKGGLGRGLGSGVSLKTGAAPGFSREPMPQAEPSLEDSKDAGFGDGEPSNGGPLVDTSIPQADGRDGGQEVKLVGKPMMFKPLSVARKPQKKKKPVAAVSNPAASSGVSASEPPRPVTQTAPAPKPRASLFSISQEETSTPTSTSNGEYTPLIYSAETAETAETTDLSAAPAAASHTPTPTPSDPGPQSLDSIASDLNLPESARRQLLGRSFKATTTTTQTHSTPAPKVLNFNLDAEYAANEALRATGETVQHNPVRAIAPGKHSLKQLVSAASNQREALEESFAKGKRNKREAGGKYGW